MSRRMPRARLAQILAFALLGHIGDAQRACQSSEYCSLGKLQPFVGDLYQSKPCMQHVYGDSATNITPPCSTSVTGTGEELQRALQLRSYKQEVIIMVTDLRRLDSFLQAADSLNQLGLDNILLLSHSEAMCNLITPLVPETGCAWSTHKHPADLQGNFYVWSLRYRILAR